MKGIAVTPRAGSHRDFFWLDDGFAMHASSPARGLGFDLNFGGIFTSVPVAVATLATRSPVLSANTHGLGPVAAVGKAPAAVTGEAAATTIQGPSSKATAGQDLVRPVGGLDNALQSNRIDLFGLGLDYAMYHKRVWGVVDQSDPSPWQSLGGTFISAPAAVVWGDRLDVFGLGTDHALYTRQAVGDLWPGTWQRLGGTFTSAASLVVQGPQRLDVFVRGADFTLRTNHTDGTTWFGWQNLGGMLASPPVALHSSPDRLDVFAVFKDGALWHRWRDSELWNDWESLGGSYVGEPAAVSTRAGTIDAFVVHAADRQLHQLRFVNETWSLPRQVSTGASAGVGLAESPSVLATGSDQFELLLPMSDHKLRLAIWNGQNWTSSSTGASFRMPSRYRLSVDQVKVDTTRSLRSDTDAAAATVAAGNAGALTKTQWIGDFGGASEPKTSQTNLLQFNQITVDLAEPMSFSYIVINNGHGDQAKILTTLASAGDALSIAGSTSMQEDIAKGVVKFVSVQILAAIAVTIPVLGSVLGAIESWLLDELTGLVFAKCDGIVAVELRAMIGRDLFIMTDNGRKSVTVTTLHAGTPASGCGADSKYEVTWTIHPL